MTIHLLHGIHTAPTSRRLRDLAPVVEEAAGEEVRYHEYGDIWAVQTASRNPKTAERLLPLIAPGDALVGHSNGAAVWLRVLMLGASAWRLTILNGALRADTDFLTAAPQLEQIDILYNDDDEAVPWARRSIHWLTDPLWGDLGRVGYKGPADARVARIDCERTPGLPPLRGHSAILDKPAAEAWARYWGARLRR